MPSSKEPKKPEADTIRTLPDALRDIIESMLDEAYPARATGRPRVDLRLVIDGIIFRMRTGVQWNRLPKQFGSDRTVHRYFQRFSADGLSERLWAVLAGACDDLGGVDRRWQGADGRMGKARFGGERDGPGPHRPGRAGHQDQPDRRGGPLAAGCGA